MDQSRENNPDDPTLSAGRTVGEAAASAAQRVGETIEQGKETLAEMQTAVAEKTRECCTTADSYVRENPWQAVGIAAGIGLLIGLLIARR